MIQITKHPSAELRASFEALWKTSPSNAPLPPIREWLDSDVPTLYIYEKEPEGDNCTGLCLIQDPVEEPWIFLYVSPEHRRQQIATRLLNTGIKKVSSPDLYYMAYPQQPEESLSFLSAKGFQIFSRECIMALDSNTVMPVSELTKTSGADQSSVVQLTSCSPDDFRSIYTKCFELEFQPDEGNYYFIRNTTGDTVGGLALTPYQNGWFLFDLCILPKHRKHGYAAAAIAAALRQPHPTGQRPDRILLHVSTANRPAYALYRKIGFTTIEETTLYNLTK